MLDSKLEKTAARSSVFFYFYLLIHKHVVHVAQAKRIYGVKILWEIGIDCYVIYNQFYFSWPNCCDSCHKNVNVLVCIKSSLK